MAVPVLKIIVAGCSLIGNEDNKSLSFTPLSKIPMSISFSKTLNPHPLPTQFYHKSTHPHPRTLIRPPKLQTFRPISAQLISFPSKDASFPRRDIRAFAGRSKKPSGESDSSGRTGARKERKRSLRGKTKQFAESFFYRLKNPHKIHADNFTQDELQMIGLGYDRFVRFMEPDDPNLKHPYDWYKYGEYGPYSWRGIVVGDPIIGTPADERVTMIGEVKDQEEWEQIEMHEMGVDFGTRLQEMDESKGFRYFWVFVRHPKWRVSELPWQQWTLVCEVVLEAGDQRLDKWNLMARLGSKARQMVTQCAAWMRPDIIYVKKPVYQCRFEPQDKFFEVLRPLLDPETEGEYLFELRSDDGRVEYCTYFGGLCRIVKVSPKAYVDDVVKGYVKLSDEKKSKCLEFLLTNHPIQLLHPYTREWKAKLEEEELGCDAPDDYEDGKNTSEDEITDWIEDDGEGEDGQVIEMNAEEEPDEEELDIIDDEAANDVEEDEDYWEKEFSKALSSNEGMEQLAKKAVQRASKRADKRFEKQTKMVSQMEKSRNDDDGDELAMRGKKAKITPEEWKGAGYGPFRRRIQKSKAPPGQFLRAAIRPFTYRNLVKEIVLMRHAILDGEIKKG
ncbi:unnamed protein product [Rhodiola kirilowii]